MDAFGKTPKFAAYRGLSAGSISKHVSGSAQTFIEGIALGNQLEPPLSFLAAMFLFPRNEFYLDSNE